MAIPSLKEDRQAPPVAADGAWVERRDSLNPYVLRHRRLVVIAAHLALLSLAYWIAVSLRFDFEVPERYYDVVWSVFPLVLLLRMATFAGFGLFHGWWRHAGMHDLLSITKAVTVSSVLLVAVLFGGGVLPEFPRSIVVLDWLLCLFVIGGARFSLRMAREERIDRRRAVVGKPTLILGAGVAAEQLLRHIRFDPASEIRPIGLLDDDTEKHGMRLHGVPILGTTEDLARIAETRGARLLVIATPSATRAQMKRMVDLCVATGLQFKIVPSLRELVDGTTRIGQLRSVEIEDLLGRDSVSLDLEQVEVDLGGSTVLITGGAGSIGSELARQVAAFGPARLILVEQAESNLYFTHMEIAEAHPTLEVLPVVADVCDERRMSQIFARHRPDYVFHAAAYKHVPLMEANVGEAVRNNVLGTLCVARRAAEYGARKFVLISTDKAVRPSSVMGATKRISERIVLGLPELRQSGTDFRAVRFGNVLGSDGSVIPLFKRQLAAGAPITVTHPDITRYFMTIPEAVQLVLMAAALPEAAGRISMLEMGEPVRILDLAENLIRLSGLEPYTDVPIVFSGLRPGEKLHEELMSSVEATVGTSLEKVRVVQTDETDGFRLLSAVDRLAAGVRMDDSESVLPVVCEMVPECVLPLRNWIREAPRRGEATHAGSQRPAEVVKAVAR
jgi:FlaA1/EpsC-like NDP-sugar epimerase